MPTPGDRYVEAQRYVLVYEGGPRDAEALLVLEREAAYKADNPTRPGLFVYQFEAITRNRLGYMDGLGAMAADPQALARVDAWLKGQG